VKVAPPQKENAVREGPRIYIEVQRLLVHQGACASKYV